MKHNTLLTTLFLLQSLLLLSQRTHKELGTVNWMRDYDTALSLSEETGKDVLILFQEIPGCMTCQNYGSQVLSDPFLVDIIENEFIPLAVFNNHKGKDKIILEKYNEPSWNNPVVRIVDQKGKDVVDRLSGNYSSLGLANQIKTALNTNNTIIPEYLNLLIEDLAASQTEEAYYKMYCFWSGEGHLGNKSGVLQTEAGWMSGHEVVKVNFDKTKISEKELSKYAAKANCDPIDPAKFKLDKDPQYYLKRSAFKHLALSPLQRTKINSALYNKQDPGIYLSPTQLKYFAAISKDASDKPILYREDFKQAWNKMKTVF